MNRQLASRIEHTLLRADATAEEIDRLCQEAVCYGFASVCVNSLFTARAARQLAGSDVAVCTTVGFPLGAMSTEAKAFEAAQAVADGADEIDMVMPIGAFKSGDLVAVEIDISAVVKAAKGKPVKVILETCLLTAAEIVEACRLAEAAGAAYVKTSTGFSSGGARVEDVRLMRDSVSSAVRIKAAGGIRNAELAHAMLEAGADRLGCSAGVAIVKE